MKMPGLVEQFVKSKLQTKIFVLMVVSYLIIIIATTAYSYLRVEYVDVKEAEERKKIEQTIEEQ